MIVNADDFGLTSGINRGIIEAHERGIVTSTSLMVRYATAAGAADYARAHPDLSVGLHFELAEWFFSAGEWRCAYEVVDPHDADAVAAEFESQLALFERLMHRAPTHLDSHQHMHRSDPARTLMMKAAERLRVPLRSFDARIKYRGEFYGQTAEGEQYREGVSRSHLIEVIGRSEPGWTEIGCHPGYAAGLDSVYKEEREEELRVLCSGDLREVLRRNGIELRSFRDFAEAR